MAGLVPPPHRDDVMGPSRGDVTSSVVDGSRTAEAAGQCRGKDIRGQPQPRVIFGRQQRTRWPASGHLTIDDLPSMPSANTGHKPINGAVGPPSSSSYASGTSRVNANALHSAPQAFEKACARGNRNNLTGVIRPGSTIVTKRSAGNQFSIDLPQPSQAKLRGFSSVLCRLQAFRSVCRATATMFCKRPKFPFQTNAADCLNARPGPNPVRATSHTVTEGVLDVAMYIPSSLQHHVKRGTIGQQLDHLSANSVEPQRSG
ncbi:hypothetical protein ACCO45_005125 [Purpureocillium lilacinum]|uniref:Uncharacterized protein n=1 Tax=Purpureocillium lilacinum TaxID=33203 RepID=A0ACC4DXL2_PURLI